MIFPVVTDPRPAYGATWRKDKAVDDSGREEGSEASGAGDREDRCGAVSSGFETKTKGPPILVRTEPTGLFVAMEGPQDPHTVGFESPGGSGIRTSGFSDRHRLPLCPLRIA